MGEARGRASRWGILAVAAIMAAGLLVAVPRAGAAVPPGPVVNFCALGGITQSIVSGPDGNLWYTNLGSSSVGRITPAGAATTFSSGGLPGGAVYYPAEITPGPDGNLWFSNLLDASIGRVTPAGSLARFSAPFLDQPVGIAAGPDGNLWFGNQRPMAGSGTIGRVTTGGVFTEFADPSIGSPFKITAGPDGNLWFTDRATLAGAIGRITPAGVVTKFTGPGVSGPRDIVTGPDGNLWFTNGVNSTIGRITPAGTVTSFAHATIDGPIGITAGPDGALWFNDANAIGRITTAGVVSEFTHETFTNTTDITAGPDGNIWFVREATVGRMSLTPAPPLPPGLQISSPSRLPCAQAQRGYSTTLTAQGGTPPYRWKKLSKLPPGLRLKAKTGVISGIPTKRSVGTYTVVIQVQDDRKPRPRLLDTQTFTITVDVRRPSLTGK